MVNTEIVRSWVVIYVTDRILEIAFNGSVRQAATTCESLAGLEYAEIANELVLASEPFERSIASAAKFLVGSNWKSLVSTPDVNKGNLVVTADGRKLRCKTQEHYDALVAAHEMFAMLNRRADAVVSEEIQTEEEIRKCLAKAFDNVDDLVHLCSQTAEQLHQVACKRLNSKISLSKQAKTATKIPGTLLGTKIQFAAPEESSIAICDLNMNELTQVAGNVKVSIDPAWGYTFIANGPIASVEFFD